MKLRITLLIPLLLVFSTLISSLLLYYQGIQIANKRIHQEGLNTVQLDISRLQNILYNRLTEANVQEARLNISVSAMDPAVRDLILVDDNDNILIANRYTWEGSPAESTTHYQAQTAKNVRNNNQPHVAYDPHNNEILQGYFPITLQIENRHNQPTRQRGILFVEYSIAASLERAELASAQQSATFAGLMLLVTVIVALLLHRLVSTRINKLNTTAQSLALGNLDVRAELGGADELTQLGNSFNNMMMRIKEDIQRRENAEQALQVLNTNLEQLIQKRTTQLQDAQRIAHIGNWELDLDNNKSFWSNEVFRILGCEPGDFLPSRDAFFAYIHPDDRHLVEQATQLIQTTKTDQSLEYRIVRGDGEIVWLRGQIVGNFNPRGEMVRLSGVIQDITQNKNEELEREQLQQQLRQSQKMETLGQLTGGIAHDFNNMLTSIIGFTQLAQLLNVTDEKGKLPHYLEQISKVGDRAKTLVAQMLAFSRINKDVEEVEPINLNEFIADTITMLRPIIPSNIEISLSKPGSEYMVMANSVMLNQVIMNLCLNAKDAIIGPHGRISIDVSEQMFEHDICSSCHHDINGEYINISFHDSGSGITDDTLDKLFEPFFTTKGIGSGSGMGLSIVHGIIHRHNGHILVTSSPQDGTTFSLLLQPERNLTHHLKTSVNNMEDLTKGQGQHILVVDDDPAITGFLGHLLEAYDYKVTTMCDSINALEYFRLHHKQLSLIITDQTMPKLTGIEMASHMLTIDQDIPIILCTGFSEQIDAQHALKKNIKAFLNKPYQNNVLLDAIRQHIRPIVANAADS